MCVVITCSCGRIDILVCVNIENDARIEHGTFITKRCGSFGYFYER